MITVMTRLLPMMRLCGILLLALLANCAPKPSVLQDGPKTATAYVYSNGWHTDIVLRRGDIPDHLIPEKERFETAVYLKFGWGDRGSYMATDPGVWLALKAALWPSAGVLHVVGFDNPPATEFSAAEIVTIPMTTAALKALTGYIDDSIDRSEAPYTLGPGLYGDSIFYAATGRFHMFNTCNTWTARALATSGVAITVFGSWTAESVMRQLR